MLEELNNHKESEQTPMPHSVKGRDRIRSELKLDQFDDGCFELLHVYSDCQLREFVQSKGYEFHAGCAYYEFKNEVEHVSEDKQLVFMKVSSNHTITSVLSNSLWSNKLQGDKFFRPTVDSKILKKNGFLGEKVERPRIDGYVLFVQSLSGSGVRHLPANSRVLYCKVCCPQ